MEENVIQIIDGITINVDAIVKNAMHVKRLYLESCYATCSCENRKYLASIMDDR